MKPLELPLWQVLVIVVVWALVGYAFVRTVREVYPLRRPYRLSWRERWRMNLAKTLCESGHQWEAIVPAEQRPSDPWLSGPYVHSICRRCGIMTVMPNTWEELRKGSL